MNQHRLVTALGLPGAADAELRAALDETANPAVVDEVRRQRRVLAAAVAGAVNILDPAVVVFGGFLAALVETDVEEFAGAVARRTIAGSAPMVRIAELGDDRLLVGAAETAFAALLDDPVGTMAPVASSSEPAPA